MSALPRPRPPDAAGTYEPMGARALPIPTVLKMLRENPAAIADLTAWLTPEQLQQRPTPDQWSCVEILAHLRVSADGWGDAIDTIVGRAGSVRPAPLAGSDWKLGQYGHLPFAPSFAAYQRQQADRVAMLAALPPEAWDRAATEKDARAKPARTLYFYAQKLARHERTHVAHFRQVVRRLLK